VLSVDATYSHVKVLKMSVEEKKRNPARERRAKGQPKKH